MKKMAVTGALGAGKSTVCQIFADCGAHVIDTDKIAHQLIEGACRPEIIQLLGPEIESGGKIDRKKVAEIVFKNPKQLKALEEILHPQILKQIENTFETTNKLIVAEVPLLFELGWQRYFDASICVTKKDIPKTSQWTSRMAHQFSEEEKASKADYLIANDGTVEDLKKQIHNIIAKIGA